VGELHVLTKREAATTHLFTSVFWLADCVVSFQALDPEPYYIVSGQGSQSLSGRSLFE
jgi:hypothetical protein